jgi:hypothetical protein
MKNVGFMLSASALFVAVTLFNSCSEDEENIKVAPAGALVATVDGSAWESATAGAIFYEGGMSVFAEGADNSQIVLTMNGQTTGKYVVSGIVDSNAPDNTVSFTPKNASVPENPTYASVYFNAENIGEITITEIDEANKTISGTFTSKVMRSSPEVKEIQIKSGSFNKVPYEVGMEPVADNEFSAKIGGSAFDPFTIGAVKSFGNIVVNAYGSETVALNITSDTGTGTFELGQMQSDYFAVVDIDDNMYESVSGTLNISLHDKVNGRIEGTFSFTAELFPGGGSPISVSEGSFAVSY